MDVNCSFVNISVKIASTNKSWGIFRICMRRAIRKCPTFQQPEFGEPRNVKTQSEYNIVGRPVKLGCDKQTEIITSGAAIAAKKHLIQLVAK